MKMKQQFSYLDVQLSITMIATESSIWIVYERYQIWPLGVFNFVNINIGLRLLTWTVQCCREKQSIPPRNIYFEIAKPPASGTFTLKITQPVFKIY